MRSSLALRLIGSAAIWLTAALIAAGIALSAAFERQVAHTYEQQLVMQLDQLAAELEWSPAHGLTLAMQPPDLAYHQPYSGRYWQASAADGSELRSESLWDQSLALPASGEPAGTVHRHVIPGPDGQSLLVMERTVIPPSDDTRIRIAVAIDRSELTAASNTFNRLLSWSLAALGLGLLVAVALQIAFGLWPLKRLRRALARLHGHHERRLAGEWPAEVRPLVDEINELLERDEALLERTRRQAADLAHGLKTPLAVLSNEARRGASELHREVGEQAESMRKQIERHLARARAAGAAVQTNAAIDAAAAVRSLAHALARINQDKALELNVRGEGRFAGDRQDFIEMLGNLLENACYWAGRRIDIALREADGRFTVVIDDDGPGMSAAQRAHALERFGRLDESAPGSGLGLAIVNDIAALYGGKLTLEPSPQGGLRAMLAFPVP